MQVLHDHQERLRLTPPQQQALDALDDAPAALGRLELLPGGVVDRHVQQGQHDGLQLVRSRIPHEVLGDFLPDGVFVVLLLDGAIRPEQVADGEVRGRLPVGHRPDLEETPPVGQRPVAEFVQQPGFPQAGLATDGHELPVLTHRAGQGGAERLELEVAPDEPGQPLGPRGAPPWLGRGGAQQGADLDRFREPFDGDGAHGVNPHQALHQAVGVDRQQDATRP